jgi:hypothetical protein
MGCLGVAVVLEWLLAPASDIPGCSILPRALFWEPQGRSKWLPPVCLVIAKAFEMVVHACVGASLYYVPLVSCMDMHGFTLHAYV